MGHLTIKFEKGRIRRRESTKCKILRNIRQKKIEGKKQPLLAFVEIITITIKFSITIQNITEL